MALRKVRVQLLNETTGVVEDEVDVLTSAECVTFSDGETFQQKLNAGKLTGPAGAKGATGAQGPIGNQGATGPQGAVGAKGATGDRGLQGPKGDKGDDGDSVVVGTSYSNGTKKRLFFKLV